MHTSVIGENRIVWWLETMEGLPSGYISPKEAVEKLGFRHESGTAFAGFFATKREAEAWARRLGLEPVTSQELWREEVGG